MANSSNSADELELLSDKVFNPVIFLSYIYVFADNSIPIVIPAFNQGQTQTDTVNSLDGKAQFVFF